jgi:hypothetical protein
MNSSDNDHQQQPDHNRNKSNNICGRTAEDELDEWFDASFAISLYGSAAAATSQEVSLSAQQALAVTDTLAHAISLRVEYIGRVARPLLQKLLLHPRNNGVFNSPVDPQALGLTHYFDRVRCPMDLGTVKAKLLQSEYTSLAEVWRDVRLVFENAIAFNGDAHVVGQAAKEMAKDFEHDLTVLREKCSKEVCIQISLFYCRLSLRLTDLLTDLCAARYM